MRVLITGDRSWHCRRLAADVVGRLVAKYPAGLVIVHGGAGGVDAGADFCLAVHQFIANSKGTKDCARRAIEAGIPTWLIDGDDGRPKRLLRGDPRLKRDLEPLLPLR